MKNFLLFGFVFAWTISFAQVGIGTNNPSTKATLDVRSQINDLGNYLGLMLPRIPDDVTKESINPTADDEGLLVYVEFTENLEIWNGKYWEKIRKLGIPGNTYDLFISEYVCGEGSNRAIEIANFTGISKDLSEYQLLIGNGKTSEFTSINLSGTLNNEDVFLIADSNASEITNANATTTFTFDGDDAVILQTSGGADVDIMGMREVDWPYGKNIVLRKKPGFGPSLICDLNHFYHLTPDAYDDLGFHEF